MARPSLLVDVDGPLNPYAAKATRRPRGYTTHRWMVPSWVAAESRRLAMLGELPRRLKPLRVWLNPDHGPALTALPFELVWATSWEHEANDYVGPVLGLPPLPVIEWAKDSEARTSTGGLFWKTPQIVAWARGRPFAWVDDQITATDIAWVRSHHSGPALLHWVDPRIGLTDDDFATLAAWPEL
ncbi:hypothetical protein GCM10009839_51300 [Catenulispora yoronensis]|uniref:Secreted protein n=1 Tax=Catenulispora yoronensis TaxID=450799 RepID=A0ABP5GC80_9ACTN